MTAEASDRRRIEQPELAALRIAKGVRRLASALGYATVCELTLPNGRRADVVALSESGRILIIEIKSSLSDFRSDHKWPEYRDYCDQLFFALAPDGPVDLIPRDAGLIISDGYSGELMRNAPQSPVAPARRRAVILAFARHAADRLLRVQDPNAALGVLSG